MENRKVGKRNYPLLIAKGCAMGAADVVPGVSGGTIAFITGIYEELIGSIKSVDIEAFKLLFKGKLKGFWSHINGNFLLSILVGIAVSIISLSKMMVYLLNTHPILVWAFFFGLIIASSIIVAKEIKKWNIASIVAMLIGAATAVVITTMSPTTTPDTWWFIMLSGAVAICAMILPGISGSFILLLMGKYMQMMDALSTLNIPIIICFIVGAAIGIVSFSHFLSWLLKKHHNITVAVLTGFMIGSLNKVWPWKEVVSTYIDRHGEIKPLIEDNILPQTYNAINGGGAQVVWAVLLAILGLLLILVIEKVGNSFRNK